ncbi:MAG: ADP-ribosylation factor-like protein [Candidatus Hodarchaeota archaeon]
MTIRVLLYGLEKSGKSTLLNSFQEGHYTPGIPFTAQNTSEITINDNLTFAITEVGGRKEVRRFASELLNYVEAIIFVIDGSDEGSFVDVKIEFDKILNHPQSLGKPLAILFHKTDITQIHPSIIIEKLNILNRYDRPHRVFSSTAKRPEDFKQVLIWINNCQIEDRIPIQDQLSRFYIIYILDFLETKKEGLPILSILGQLEIISRTGQVEYDRDKILALLRRLRSEGDIEFDESYQIWRITVQGREKLQSSELIKGGRYEKIRAMIDANQASPAKSDKIGLDKEEKDIIDEFDLDELADLKKKQMIINVRSNF